MHEISRSQDSTITDLNRRGPGLLMAARDQAFLSSIGEQPERTPIRFSVVESPDRLSEILALRRLSYAAAEKFGPGTTARDELDPRDLASSFVIAEAAGRLIGSVRVTLPLSGAFLHHRLEMLGPIDALPAKADCVETARACIHLDFQGRGLFWHLAASMFNLCAELGRSHVVASTDPSLWRYWRRCGFEKTGVTYLGSNSNRTFSVITLDLESLLAGRLAARNLAPELVRLLPPRGAREAKSDRTSALLGFTT